MSKNNLDLLQLNEGGIAQTFIIQGLASQPLDDVFVSIPRVSNLIQVNPESFTIEKSAWQNVDKIITVNAIEGNYISSTFSLQILTQSTDLKYNSTDAFSNDAKQVIAVNLKYNINTDLPVIKMVKSARNHQSLYVAWEMPIALNTSFINTIKNIVLTPYNAETNEEDLLGKTKFPANASHGITNPLSNFIFDQVYTLAIHYEYVTNAHSNPTRPWAKNWKTTKDCSADDFYLNIEGTDMIDSKKWLCKPCPEFASCKGAVTINQLKAKFGYWSLNKTQYYQCLQPSACLGAINKRYIDRFDEATIEHNETCATSLGFQNNSRLCASCAASFARGNGLGTCVKCEKDTNVFVFLAGVLVASMVLIMLIKITVFKKVNIEEHAQFHKRWGIKKKDQVQFSDGVKKIALSYLQTVLLAASMNVPWNRTFRQLFAVQNTVASFSKAFFLCR